jgi:fatty-acyl-CoA synthase
MTGGAPALARTIPDVTLTTSYWPADAERVAQALLARFEPGEHVAVWAPNVPEWVLLRYGAALAGMVLVTVNPAYRPAELEYVLRQSRAAGVFLLPEYRTNSMAEALTSVRSGLPDLRSTPLLSSDCT